ncbi:MAG: FecR domain-containing protein [Luteolibacter sp.]
MPICPEFDFRPMRRVFLVCSAVLGIAGAQDAKVLEVENIAQAAKGKGGGWTAAEKDQSLAVGDRFRTRQRSRATLRLTQLYTMRLEQFTTIQVTPGLFQDDKSKLDLSGGAAFIFSREKNGEIDIATPAANGAMRGTQLYVQVAKNGLSKFQVLEGQVVMENAKGRLVLDAGEAGEALPGQAPKRTASIIATNLLQWALYYPAVLDPAELGMNAVDRRAAGQSLEAYRAGDLLGALESYPEGAASSVGGKLYRAGVLLGVGRVDEVRATIAGVPASNSGRRAIDRMIAAVKFNEKEEWDRESISTSGEALAESYYLQSRSDLKGAREAARLATRLAPDSGYTWTRLAELEFSFSRIKEATAALESALRLTPKNAQAHALKGFVLSADNDIAEARASFEEAVRLDGALGNGWLGLGLTKIKCGDLEGGRADLQTAATVEPTVSGFHSYLGKAFSMEDKPGDARKDLDLARRLDPDDPTPLLYSALELQQRNRTNEAIGDLEKSIELNDNRRVYRSQQLLDQDKAVRSANLAKIYQNAGMRDVAVREATRAVENDYTNPSAHLFLANSFDALRDPKRIALRYETPWFNELLLSNLLAPVGGGPLSQFVSQQEYSKLLEEDGIGASFSNEWRSTGELRSNASVFGTSGDVSFGIDTYYRDDSGDRFNSESNLQEIYGQFKWQPTPDDVFYFLGKWADQQSGDNFETYDNQPLAPGVNFEESQEPGLLLAGWNHRWAPGSHTLVLVGRLGADQRLADTSAQQLLIERDSAGLRPGFIQPGMFGFDQFTDPALANSVTVAGDGQSLVYSDALIQGIQPFLGQGNVVGVNSAPFAFETDRSFEIFTAEIQHILQSDRNLIVAGGRLQAGTFETESRLSLVRPNFTGGFSTPASVQKTEVDFQRMTIYGYDYWNVTKDLTLIGGVSWDRIEHPDNFRNPPVNDSQREEDQLSGKFGFTYAPSRRFTMRGVYTEGMGGVTFDESVRLEPVQLAGFNQAYRTVISESLAGSVETPLYQIWGLSVEGSLPTRTWWGASVNVIEQDVDRTIGAFTGYDSGVFPISPAYFPDSTSQRLDYREVALGITLNQLIGDEFAVGAGYRMTRSDLRTMFPELLASGTPIADVKNTATLHEVMLNAHWNSLTGLFATIEANWYLQDLDDDPRGLAPGGQTREGDDFWQFNALLGYRFNRNQAEISAGVLNIADSDYRLSPLSPYGNIARDRTAVVRCRFNF